MTHSFTSVATIKSINLFVLFLAVFLMLFLPVKKEVWYDESISIKCSKGISQDTPTEVGKSGTLSSDEIRNLNTVGNVYNATLVDNGNSFIYNLLLHWFSLLFGNTVIIYEFFSRLCGVAVLLAFFKLCRLFFGNTLFSSLAIILFLTDVDFWGMSHEIRAYALGMFFVAMAIAHLVRFIYIQEKPIDLLLAGLFSVGAILSHYLSVYIIVVLLGYLFFVKRGKLFTLWNLLAMAVPILLIGAYIVLSFSAFQTMDMQNHKIAERLASKGFSIGEVFTKSLHFTDINFKAVFPAFKGNSAIVVISFLLVAGLFAGTFKMSNSEQRKNTVLLFVLGISGTIFLALLSIKAHHYTALYYRYYSFCVPFASLSVAYGLMILAQNRKINPIIKTLLIAVFLIPGVVLFAMGVKKANPEVRYSAIAIAKTIDNDNIRKVGVPSWSDALFLQCFIGGNQKIEYILNTTSNEFVLYAPTGERRVAVIRNDN